MLVLKTKQGNFKKRSVIYDDKRLPNNVLHAHKNKCRDVLGEAGKMNYIEKEDSK